MAKIPGADDAQVVLRERFLAQLLTEILQNQTMRNTSEIETRDNFVKYFTKTAESRRPACLRICTLYQRSRTTWHSGAE